MKKKAQLSLERAVDCFIIQNQRTVNMDIFDVYIPSSSE